MGVDALELETFISSSDIDERAAEALRQASEDVQQAVIGRGSLVGARNPSSVLLARLRECSAPTNNMPDVEGAGYVRMRGLPYNSTMEDVLRFFDGFNVSREGVVFGVSKDGRFSGEAFVQFRSTDLAADAIRLRNKETIGERYIELFESSPSEVQRATMPRQDLAGAAPPSHEPIASVEEFLRANPVDERAATTLRELPPDSQRVVIERGSLASARNPSSVLLGRIRDLEKEQSQDTWGRTYAHAGGGPSESRKRPRSALDDQVEELIKYYDIEPHAADEFRSCDAAVQETVLQKGIKGARHPTSALMARIRDALGTGYGRDTRDDRYREEPNAGYNDWHGDAGYPPRPNALQDDVERFIATNGIDNMAAETFRSCEPQIQEYVLEYGDMRNAQNPSSALLARIKEAGVNTGVGAFKKPRVGPRIQDPEEFIRMYKIDERSADALRDLSNALRQEVLNRGGLGNARNPSSVLLSRIRDVKNTMPVDGGSQDVDGYGNSGRQEVYQNNQAQWNRPRGLADDVEDLIKSHDIDHWTAEEFRACSIEVQEAVLAKGVKGARNPSSALRVRIKDAQGMSRQDSHHGPSARDDRGPRGVGAPRRTLTEEVEDFIRTNGIDDRAAATFRACPAATQESVLERADLRTARNPSSALMALIKESQGTTTTGGGSSRNSLHQRAVTLAEEVDAFIFDNGIDEKGAEMFRAAGPEVQEWVLDRGNVGNARNPSSVLLSRIREAQASLPAADHSKGGGGQGKGGAFDYSGYNLPEAVQMFVRNNGVDTMAAETLQAAPPGVQEYVLDRGDMRNAQNPSSALLARIKEGHANVPGAGDFRKCGPYAPPTSDVEEFIRTYDFDGRSADALRDMPPGQQQEVISRGSLANARNPSSVLLSRIREVQALGQGPGAKDSYESPAWGAYPVPPTTQHGHASLRDRIEDMLRAFDIDHVAADTFRACTPEVQETVLQKGIKGARNPSSALLARIRDAMPSGREHHGGPAHEPRHFDRRPIGLFNEVTNFIHANQIDERAGEALRACAPEVQEWILDRAELRTARNPSSALMALLKEGPGQSARGPPPLHEVRGSLVDEVEDFIRRSAVDHRAADSLRACSPAVQQACVERGVIENARNPSALLLSRIKEVSSMQPGGGGKGGPPPFHDERPMRDIRDEVEDFIMNNRLDGKVADSLRGCAPRVQKAVITRGGVTGARNPESVVMARIRDVTTSSAGESATLPFIRGAGYVRLRGLPFNVTKEDVLDFLRDFRLRLDCVVFVKSHDGRSTGEAFVEVHSEEMARDVVREADGKRIGERYIEVFAASYGEVQRALPDVGGGGGRDDYGSSGYGHGRDVPRPSTRAGPIGGAPGPIGGLSPRRSPRRGGPSRSGAEERFGRYSGARHRGDSEPVPSSRY